MSSFQSEAGPIAAPRESKHKSILREIVETILLTVFIYLVVNAAMGRFRIQGASMEPTLHSGQFVITNKITYQIGQPQRGDIIVFIAPRTAQEEDYIKRIIGLPGETVKIDGGKVYVDGQTIEEPYIADPPQYSSLWTVQEGEYFVLGDNRNHSNDSHDWGLLKKDAILGKAWLIYWPPKFWGLVPNYSEYSLASSP